MIINFDLILYFVFWMIFSLPVNSTDTSIQEDSGCPLIKSSSLQQEILANISRHKLYGKKFTCHGKDVYQYEFVICGDVKESLPNVSLLKINTVEGKEKDVAIGYRNRTNVAARFGLGGWILMELSAMIDHNETNLTSSLKGTNASVSAVDEHVVNLASSSRGSNSSIVMILCDTSYPNGEFHLLYEDKENFQFVFELRIAAICDTPSGLSGFAILIIILVVALVLYFIIGVLYNRIQLGAKGVDQIPNRTFWFGIGNAFADCCSAVCRCERCCSDPMDHLDAGSHYSGGYSPIGEGATPPIPSQSFERDSQLIKP